MFDVSERRIRLHTGNSDLVSEDLKRHLETEGRASIVVPGAEGWRHCPPNANLSLEEIRAQTRALRKVSLERIASEEFSPGEEAFFQAEIEKEL